MKSEEGLIEDGAINKDKEFPRSYVSAFYRDQVAKFIKLGIGNETENGVVVTQRLIDITNKRLTQIQPLTSKIIADFYERLLQVEKREKE